MSKDAVIGKGVKLGDDVSIYPLVFVGDNALIGDRVTLYPGVFIGEGVTIGKDSIIHANVSVYQGCRIGERVIIHAGSVIGSDGFGFAKDREGYYKILQVGTDTSTPGNLTRSQTASRPGCNGVISGTPHRLLIPTAGQANHR